MTLAMYSSILKIADFAHFIAIVYAFPHFETSGMALMRLCGRNMKNAKKMKDV